MNENQPDPTLERTFQGHKDSITSLCFNPNGKQLASGSLDHTVLCYNFKPGQRAFKFIGHQGPIFSVDFHPSGQLLASASGDQTVKLWTPTVKGDVTTFKAHSSSVRSVQFSSDGNNILTCSDDKTIKIWSTHRTKFQHTLSGHSNWVRDAKWSADGKLIVSGSDDKSVRLWDVSKREAIKSYYEHSGMITSVCFHPSSHLIASASSDRSINVWDIRTHKLLQHYEDAHGKGDGMSGVVQSVACGGGMGEWLISTGGDGLVKIWDLQEGHLFYTLYGHKVSPTTCAVFSQDDQGGRFFASAGADAQVLVWNARFNQYETEEKTEVPLPSMQRRGKKEQVFGWEDEKKKGKEETKERNNLESIQFKKHEPAVESVDVAESFHVPTHYESNNYTTKTSNPIPELTQAMTQLVQQMDLLTHTISLMEDRLSRLEDSMK